MRRQKLIKRLTQIIVSFIPLFLFFCTQSDKDLRINYYPDDNRNAPEAVAGPDTTVGINDTVHLHGIGIDTAGGSIIKYEWKFGNSDWVVTSSGDTTIIAPPTAQSYVCSLRVTDDDGFTGVDKVTITVTPSDPVRPLTSADSVGPVITLVTPEKDSTKVSESSLSVTVTCTDQSGIASVTCISDGELLPVIKGADHSYSVGVSGLTAGKNTLVFIATDGSSNANQSKKIIKVFYDPDMNDKEGPIITLVTPEKDSTKISDSLLSVTVTCTDPNGIASVTCIFNGELLSVKKNTDSSYSVEVTGLVEGYNTLIFIATDGSSHSNQSKKSVTINHFTPVNDKEGPIITLVTPEKDSTKVSESSLNITVTCRDPSGIASVTCMFNDELMVVSKGADDSYSVGVTGLAAGRNTLVFIATDGSPNANQSKKSVTVNHDPGMNDKEGPVITLVTPEKDSVKVNEPSLSITVTCTDSSGIASVTCGFQGKTQTFKKNADSSYSVNVTGLAVGNNTLVFIATDESPNANQSSKSITVNHDPTMNDKEGPVIALVTPEKDSTRVNKSSLGITVTCTDPSGIASVNCKFSDKLLPVNKGADSSYSVNITGLTVGENTLIIIAIDGSSNANLSKKSIKVIYISPVSSISAGGTHSLFLKPDSTLWSCGENGYGQLGDGTNTNRSKPRKIMGGVKSIVAGGLHSLILRTDGTLWTCGDNRYGQLGDGTTTKRSTPVQIMDGVKGMAAGMVHSLILRTNGTLWACGDNKHGQLGDGTTINRSTPVQIMGDIKSMAAGAVHSLILRTDGTLWTCGNNTEGQLGDKTPTDRSKPVQVIGGVNSLAAGSFHSLILRTDGTLWVCGDNSEGQLGDGTINNRWNPVLVMIGIQSMTAGYLHSCILRTDGTLWACGRNTYGQLGDGTVTRRLTPVRVMSNVKSMAAGDNHNLILRTDGTLWSYGDNSKGQLGIGTFSKIITPVQINF